MDYLVMGGQLILGLTILVGVHEWGHMFFAKKFGMKVEKFSIGFPPKLFGKKFGETEYSLGAIPLGGFVKISGMIDESMDKEQMAQPPQPWEFRSKPAWQRLLVMLGGIIVNVIVGILIFVSITFVFGESYIPAKNAKHGIYAHPVAESIGLKTGDKIIKINGKELVDFADVYSSDVLLGDNAYYTIDRNGDIMDIKIPNDLTNKLINDKGDREDFIELIREFSVANVEAGTNADKGGLMAGDEIVMINETPIKFYHEFEMVKKDNLGKEVTVTVVRGGVEKTLEIIVGEDGKMGFVADFGDISATKEYNVLQAIPRGTVRAFTVITDNLKGFAKIFKGEVDANKSIQGPIGIAKIFGATWDWQKFWSITGLLSMILAFMNLLPIPALDGGHVMFLSYEMLSGRKPSDKFLERAQVVGMVILLGIMSFAFYSDIARLF